MYRAIIARSNDLNTFFNSNEPLLIDRRLHADARPWVEVANFILGVVKQVLDVERHIYFIVLLFERCESSKHFLDLVGQQDRFHRFKHDLTDILFWHLPLIF